MKRLFKVLAEDGTAYHGGHGRWNFPRDGHPGAPMPRIEGTLVPCQNGYHLCREEDLIGWLGPTIYLAQYRGDIVLDTDKVVVREARLLRKLDVWNARTQRLFAADCAEHVLFLFEKVYPKDNRPRNAIEVARRFTDGQATGQELTAAWDAAWEAAKPATWDVAWNAARAAAKAAAWAAVKTAVWAAAKATAWDAERHWQTSRLMEYLFPAPEGSQQ